MVILSIKVNYKPNVKSLIQKQGHSETHQTYFLSILLMNLFIYLGFYITFNTVQIQVISRRVVERAEEISTHSSSGFCTVNCRPMASNYQLSHFRLCREPNPGLRGGRRECYHSATMAPFVNEVSTSSINVETYKQTNCHEYNTSLPP